MTRYARAKGSKSSNERLPEEATSWHVMKQQLEEKQRATNKPLPQRKVVRCFPNVGENKRSEWAEFEEPKEKKMKQRKKDSGIENDTKEKDYLNQLSFNSNKVGKKSSKNKFPKKINMFEKEPVLDESVGIDNEQTTVSTEKKNKKNKNKRDNPEMQHVLEIADNFSEANERSFQGNKLQQDEPEISNQSLSKETGLSNFEYNTEQRNDKGRKKSNKHKLQNRINEERSQNFDSDNTRVNKKSWNKSDNRNLNNRTGKTRNDKEKPYKRRKPDTSSEIMFINGKRIEVVKYDGFPVKKEDAERLKELRKNMLSNGIPKDEVAASMKLERRRAEKALARERKKVCFHCRKSGHLLSECPELGNSNDAGTGVCFKCGSTEHTHFECKVVRGADYRFAECFICKEQGHISRQCPDNPRGLYPKGGACNVCGDVTHLKKDCPDLIAQKEGQTMTLETLNVNSVEVLDEDIQKSKTDKPGKNVNRKKTVKF
ncbi:hypothetical protein C0J52_04315 [Blattella germanica]|nr:hypothetical protein C0J52_04315 [Blattella germanica]